MSRNFLIVGLIVIAVAAVGFLLISNKAKVPSSHPMMTASPVTTSPTISSSPSASQNVVTLTQSGFNPSTITIKVGDSVTWVNKSGQQATVNSNPHPTHTNYPPLNLGGFADGSSLTLTFPTPGTFGYHNHLNPSETGTIIVK